MLVSLGSGTFGLLVIIFLGNLSFAQTLANEADGTDIHLNAPIKRDMPWIPTTNRVHVYRALPTSIRCKVPGPDGTSKVDKTIDTEQTGFKDAMVGAVATGENHPFPTYRSHFLTKKGAWHVGFEFQVEDRGKQNRFKDIQIMAVWKVYLVNPDLKWKSWADCTKNAFGDDIYTLANGQVFDPISQ